MEDPLHRLPEEYREGGKTWHIFFGAIVWSLIVGVALLFPLCVFASTVLGVL